MNIFDYFNTNSINNILSSMNHNKTDKPKTGDIKNNLFLAEVRKNLENNNAGKDDNIEVSSVSNNANSKLDSNMYDDEMHRCKNCGAYVKFTDNNGLCLKCLYNMTRAKKEYSE